MKKRIILFLKKQWWKYILKPKLLKITNKHTSSTLLQFPMLVYIELAAEQIYINKGFSTLMKDLSNEAERVANVLRKTMKPMNHEEYKDYIKEIVDKQNKQEGLERKANIDRCKKLIEQMKYN